MAKNTKQKGVTARTRKIQKRAALRRCSLCARVGHNKKTCLENVVSATKKPIKKTNNQFSRKKISTPKENIQKKSASKVSHIFVNAHQKTQESKHIIDLSKNKKDIWSSIKAYSEEPAKKTKRHTLNFAQLVKSANSQKTKVAKNLPKTAEKRIHSKPLALNSFFRVKEFLSDAFFSIQNFFTIPAKYFDFKKFAYSMVVFLFLVSIPFPAAGVYRQVKDDTNYIVQRSTDAFLALQSSTVAALSTNIEQAQFDLNEALSAFTDAQSLIDREYKALTYVASALPVVGKRVQSRQQLLVAGHHIALGNTYLVKGIEEASEKEDLNNTDRISILKVHLRSALPQYQEALLNLANVDHSALPVEFQESFSEFKILFATFIDDINDLSEVMSGIEKILGSDQFKRYLVLFQNHHELRATGGFVGSFAIVDVQKGRILNIEIPGGGSYDLQGYLDTYLAPPLPLQIANGRWEFQDSNWFASFPASAEKASWFYEHSSGRTVDGVIAINASVLERLVKVMGPVYNENYDLLINSENALSQIQREVEVEYDREINQPKAVLSELLDQMLAGLKDIQPVRLVDLLSQMHSALTEKEIQIYMTDDSLQRDLSEFGWTGELLEENQNQDYLMVVNTNIGGEKTDAKIDQAIDHQSHVQSDGSVINTVIVRREHSGNSGELFYGKENINYLRVYVPEGSELIEAGGFSYPEEESFMVPEPWYEDDQDLEEIAQTETIHVGSGTRITNEFKKTAFANWIVTNPGKTTEVYFVYRLPFKVLDTEMAENSDRNIIEDIAMLAGNKLENSQLSHYSLLSQKQSGTNAKLNSTIIYPDGWNPVWRTNDDVHVTLNGATYNTGLNTDKVYGVVMKKIEE